VRVQRPGQQHSRPVQMWPRHLPSEASKWTCELVFMCSQDKKGASEALTVRNCCSCALLCITCMVHTTGQYILLTWLYMPLTPCNRLPAQRICSNIAVTFARFSPVSDSAASCLQEDCNFVHQWSGPHACHHSLPWHHLQHEGRRFLLLPKEKRQDGPAQC
jgi:hypothetical protein